MKNLLILSCIFILTSCKESIETARFDAFLFEPCMLLNYEQDNTIEGNYLIVESIDLDDSSIVVALPHDFYLYTHPFEKWVIGWGTDKPLYDAGNENLRHIKSIDATKGKIQLGELLRGNSFPTIKTRICFWNTEPSDYKSNLSIPIINTAIWPSFSGKSISFGAVDYDSSLGKWVMLVNECDTSSINIYAATSNNLKDWQAANNGFPILTPSDFKQCSWAGKDKSGTYSQTPFVSDMTYYKNKWYLFLDGYCKQGKRHIGLAISSRSMLGPYTILKDPIISPGVKGTWNDEACFYAKVKAYKNGFILFYDGRSNGLEQIGLATSKDLLNWSNNPQNPVLNQHSGWRSAPWSTEPTHVDIHNDSIFLLAAGVKEFKMGFWHHYITKRMYKDKSGNVSDAQLGLFVSADGGKNFIPHEHNPVFVNNYSNLYENDHMGGNFERIVNDSIDILIYQAKSTHGGLKYNILSRWKKHH